ncbi:uncharacterized protein LOC124998102 [Mugil cephalus]|uniref:uncharacterized protein LOC124998102 n=1 Tax=Mugil cephalus TaxID=48193 RepID=UPI001FB830E0|nr:uncharacterized protein LOC124998102 [Mugil cephalus]
MTQGVCGCICKYILYFFIAIFGLWGFYILWLGVQLRFSDNTKQYFFKNEGSSSNGFKTGVESMMGLGLLLVVSAWIGKKGVYNGSKGALEWFAVLLGCLSGAAFAAGDFAYYQRDEASNFLVEFYPAAYIVYAVTGDQAVGITLAFIQDLFHCCGITGVSLIEFVKQTCPRPKNLMESLAMPSCPVLIIKIFETHASVVKDDFDQIGAFLVGALICSLVLIKQQDRSGQ